MTIGQHTRCIVIAVFLCAAQSSIAQFLTVTDIIVEGNKRTKETIILRELEFKVGDRIQQSQLAHVLEENKFNLLSTGSFTSAEMNVAEWDVDASEIEVKITVSEAPWIVPVPVFELADRNFNVWWNEFNASLSRVNYGLQLALLNAWGYGERFRITAQFGYTPKFKIDALLPFLDNNQTVRLEINASYQTNKEIAVFNENNIKVFRRAPDERIIFKRQEYKVGLLFRPKIFARHVFRLSFNNNWIDEQHMLEYNTDFFLDSRSRQRYLTAEYEFQYDKRDLPVMPTKGWLFSMKFYKSGFGFFDDLSATYFEPNAQYIFTIKPRLIASVRAKMKLALERNQQPFYNYQGLGYGDDFIRGYELYIADALDYYVGKVSLQYMVWESKINFKKLMPIKGMRVMPFRIYLAANYDTGYANDPWYFKTNSFTNRWLHGGGLGLNVLVYNTVQFQVECSVNHLGQKGVFLHSNTAF